ncbi:MAG: DUF2961 domain-containing protein [Planctomycetes bacterium]|nr:DUF2961 domain-containing protein [Planctomycetota bacterium]
MSSVAVVSLFRRVAGFAALELLCAAALAAPRDADSQDAAPSAAPAPAPPAAPPAPSANGANSANDPSGASDATRASAEVLTSVDSIDRARLLAEAADRDAVARLDSPNFRTRLFSSFDRRAASRDRNWFADSDRGQSLRSIERSGRREAVLVDARGPGALVGGFATPLAGRLRVYLDGGAEPALDLEARAFFAASESAACGRLREPIPFARRCVVTTDAPDGVEYAFEAREYPPGTAVTTLSPAEFGAPSSESATPVGAAPSTGSATQVGGPPRGESLTRRFEGVLSPANPGAPIAELELSLGPEFAPRGQVIRELELSIEPLDPKSSREDVLRRTLLTLEFDGERTVDVPVGDFFGCAAGRVEQTRGRARVEGERLISTWPMPYRQSARLVLRQSGKERVAVRCSVEVEAFDHDERTLRFGAQWTALAAAPTAPARDWRVLSLEGRGKLVGEVLALGMPLRTLATRGDTKVWVDGEGFPSHFATSYEAAFGACAADGTGFVRRDAADGSGWSVFSRERALDVVTFERSLLVERELLCDAPTELELASTTFYYLAPGARAEHPAPDVLASAGLPRFEVRAFELPGAQEGETLAAVARADGVEVRAETRDAGTWSGGREAALGGLAPGRFVEFDLPVAVAGPREVVLRLSPRPTGGPCAFAVGGVASTATFDARANELGAPRLVSLGVFELAPPTVRLRIEALGAPDDTPRELGLDCVLLLLPGS